MKIILQKNFLKEALKNFSLVENRRTTPSNIKNIKIEATDKITLSQTDLENNFIIELKGEIVAKGKAFINLNLLKKAINSSKEKSIVIESDSVKLNVNKIPQNLEEEGSTPIFFKTSKFFDPVSLNVPKFLEALEIVTPFAEEEKETTDKQRLDMVLITPSGRFVATDGHRLNIFDSNIKVPDLLKYNINDAVSKPGILLSKKIANILLSIKNISSLELSFAKDNQQKDYFMLSGNSKFFNFTFITKQIEWFYPDYERAIPTETPATKISISKSEFLNMLDAIKPLSKNRYIYGTATFFPSDKKVIAKLENDKKEVLVNLNANKNIIVTYRVKYLLDYKNILEKNKDGDITFFMDDNTSTTVVKIDNLDNLICLLMPYRLEEYEIEDLKK